MEPSKVKLQLSEQEKDALPSALIRVAEDLLNNPDVSKEDVVKLYVLSQQNCRMMLARIENAKCNKSVSLHPETLSKLRRFMDASRTHPMAGGGRFKTEGSAVDFLLCFAEKFGFEFMRTMLSNENYRNITFTSPSELSSEQARKLTLEKLDEKED